MLHLNTQSAKIFALSSLSILMVACGGGGGGSSDSSSGGTTTPPVTNPDLFTVKAKEWKIQPAANTSYCYDIDKQAESACTNTDWDVKFVMGTRTPLLFTNSGVSGSGTGGALYSPFDGKWDTLSKELDATQNGALPSTAWLVDGYSNAFMDTTNGSFISFFEYDLFADHRMSPNFKTYLLTTDSKSLNTVGTVEKPVFGLQVVNYYQGTASGFVGLRYNNTLAPNDVKTLTVDSSKGWAYVDLNTGTVSSTATGTWQIAFNRYNVQLNTNIGATVKSQPVGFYTADGKVILDKFKDTNALEATLADLKAVTDVEKVVKWGSNTVTSVLNPNFQGTYPSKLSYGWYNYYPTLAAAQADGLQAQHVLAADPNAATMLRGDTGKSYARMHLKSIVYADPTNNASATTWTFEFDVQPVK